MAVSFLLWQLVIQLFVKPSEYTPFTGQLMAQLFSQAGFPKGVFNLIQGDGKIAEKLVKHSDIDGVLFTGSYETGLKIKKATIEDYWKILALEMGGQKCIYCMEGCSFTEKLFMNVL